MSRLWYRLTFPIRHFGLHRPHAPGPRQTQARPLLTPAQADEWLRLLEP